MLAYARNSFTLVLHITQIMNIKHVTNINIKTEKNKSYQIFFKICRQSQTH